MSVVKLLGRIVAPSDVLDQQSDDEADAPQQGSESGYEKSKFDVAATLHDYSYGITSDPLTQFACAFSALIHDVGA